MTFRLSAGATATILILAVVLSGCSGSLPAESSETPPPVTPAGLRATTTPAAAAVPEAAAGGTVEEREEPPRIFGEYRWAEYRNNMTVTMPPNPRYQWESVVRIERSRSTWKGIPALREKTTATEDYPEWIGGNLVHTTDGLIVTAERYFDAATGKALGGTVTETIRGAARPQEEIPAEDPPCREDRPSGLTGITPFGDLNVTLSLRGTESVTVPAGTFPAARNYTGNFRDGTPIAFWVVPGIPVPVRYQFPNRYMDGTDPFQSYELMGWG